MRNEAYEGRLDMLKNDYNFKYDKDGARLGCIFGSNEVLFIKTGQGGSIYGYENRYLNLALEVNEKYGFTVFVSSTFEDSKESYDRDIAVLDSIFVNKSYQIYYLGVSKGGLIGIWHGCDEPKIVKMLSINAPLMINFHSKTLPGIKKLGADKLTMVYGSLDPSYKYLPFVDKHASVQIIEGADHNLVGSEMTLTEIVEKFLSE